MSVCIERCNAKSCKAPCSQWRAICPHGQNHRCLFHALSDGATQFTPQVALESWTAVLQGTHEWEWDDVGSEFKSSSNKESESWLKNSKQGASKVLVITGVPFNFEFEWQSYASSRFQIIKFVRCRFTQRVSLDAEQPCAPPGIGGGDDCWAPFNLHVLWKRCTFEKSVRFRQVEVIHPLEFEGCRFHSYCEINKCRIHRLSFHDTVFQEKLYLEDVDIGSSDPPQKFLHKPDEAVAVTSVRADFSEAIFETGAAFWNVSFHGPASFRRAEFYEATDFANPRFPIGDPCNYCVYFSMEAAHIDGSLGIRGIPSDSQKGSNNGPTEHFGFVFEAERKPDSANNHSALRINLKYMSIHKDGGLILQACNLERAELVGTNWGRCVFLGVVWPQVRATYWMWTLRPWGGKTIRRLLSKAGRKLYEFWTDLLRKSSSTTKFEFGPDKRRRGYIYGIYDHHLMLETLNDVATKAISFDGESVADYLRCNSGMCTEQTETLCNFLVLNTRLSETEVRSIINDLRAAGDYSAKEGARKRAKEKVKEAEERQWREWRHSWALISKSYRDLKKSYEENKDYIYASDFNFGEKEMRRINHEVPRFTRLQLDLFYYVSGYGERILRPCILLLILWILGAWMFEGAHCKTGSLCRIDYYQALYISGANMALLRPNDLASFETGRLLLSLLQAILGPTFGAMLVLAITNKLKR